MLLLRYETVAASVSLAKRKDGSRTADGDTGSRGPCRYRDGRVRTATRRCLTPSRRPSRTDGRRSSRTSAAAACPGVWQPPGARPTPTAARPAGTRRRAGSSGASGPLLALSPGPSPVSSAGPCSLFIVDTSRIQGYDVSLCYVSGMPAGITAIRPAFRLHSGWSAGPLRNCLHFERSSRPPGLTVSYGKHGATAMHDRKLPTAVDTHRMRRHARCAPVPCAGPHGSDH